MSSDEEDNVTSTKVTENDNDVTSDEEEEEDGMNDDFEFGGLMVRVVCYIW
jgi:hypothetical protein